MKILRLIFLLALVVPMVFSCSKDFDAPQEEIGISALSSAPLLFNDTSGWELYYIFDLIVNMEDNEKLYFLNTFGHPSWENSFQKRGDEIIVTTVPMLKNDNLTGVIKMYQTDDDSIKADFFSISELDTAITKNLNTQAYHNYRGAVQSLVLSGALVGEDLDPKYFNWLGTTVDRIDERLIYYCIEEWECGGVYTSNMTGWSFNSLTNNPIGVNLASQQGCTLISRECWIDWSPRNFPGNWSGSGGTPPDTNNGNASGTHGDSQNIFDIKSHTLNTWMQENGIPDEYFDLLYDCVIYLAMPWGEVIENDINGGCIAEKLFGEIEEGVDMSTLLSVTGHDWGELLSRYILVLAEHPELAQQIDNFIENHPNDQIAETYAAYAFFEISENPSVWTEENIASLFERYDDLSNYLETSIEQAIEIQNGITIMDTYLHPTQQVPSSATAFGGSSANPLGGPDLISHTDRDYGFLALIAQSDIHVPAIIQAGIMKTLLYTATGINGMQSVASNYMDEFENNPTDGSKYYDQALSTYVMNSTKMRNWLKQYGKELNDELTANNGNINNIIVPNIQRPAMNENNGFGILINDTQQTFMYLLDSWEFDSNTGEWNGRFMVNVTDNFGLDDDDAEQFQYIPGFVAWWALQHRRGWHPFVTDIWFVVRLSGKI